MTQRASASDRSQGQRRYSGRKPSRSFPRLPRFATLALALALLLALAACDQSAVQPSPAHPTLIPTPAGLPAFADWRAAYLSTDGFVHVVTLDGKTDLIGPALPPFKINGLVLASAGASPDGHLFAYASPGVVIANVAGAGHGTSDRDVLAGTVDVMAWSPDSQQLALSDGVGGFSVLKAAARVRIAIPGAPIPALRQFIGWIDASRLAIAHFVTVGGTTAPPAYVLSSLNVTSGALQTIATINSPGLGSPGAVISPDGSRVLFYNARFRDDPFTPHADVIDTAGGAVRPLPAIVRAIGSGFTSLAWRPGTHQLAVSTGFLPNHDLKVWLIDLDHDTATPLLSDQYVAQWSPDGATLIASTSAQAEAGLGPHDLSAVTFGPGGQPHVTLLTNDAMSFPFLGFVRTA